MLAHLSLNEYTHVLLYIVMIWSVMCGKFDIHHNVSNTTVSIVLDVLHSRIMLLSVLCGKFDVCAYIFVLK